jgi:hypothetical protein
MQTTVQLFTDLNISQFMQHKHTLKRTGQVLTNTYSFVVRQIEGLLAVGCVLGCIEGASKAAQKTAHWAEIMGLNAWMVRGLRYWAIMKPEGNTN